MKILNPNFCIMKQFYLTISLLILSTFLSAQDWVTNYSELYYISHEGKVFIEPDYSAMSVYFKNTPEKALANKLEEKFAQANRSTEQIDHGVMTMDLKEMIQIKTTKGLSSIQSLEDRQAFLKEYELDQDGAYEVLPAFKVGDVQAWLTKRIIIRLKDGIGLNQIQNILEKYDASFVKNLTDANTFIFKTDQIQAQFSIIHEINDLGLLDWGEPDFKMEILRRVDPFYQYQWHLNNTGGTDLGGKALLNDADIDAPEAWAIATGSNVTVAVIDDGLEDHEDMATLLTGYTPADGGDGTPSLSTDGHGQQCAGLIGALHNDIGVSGVSPDVSMFSVNIFAPNTTNADVADGINWAVNNGADVLSNSWGFTSCTTNINSITSAFANAATNGRGGLGCIILVASGNDFNTCVSYPANLSTVTAVGGISGDGERSNFSNYGPTLDLVAPSNDDWVFNAAGQLISTAHDLVTIDREGSAGWFTGNYSDGFGGTSGATPIAAGVAALVLSVDPLLTKTEVENILYTTVDDIGTSGFDNEYGYGRVNAYQAVLAAGGIACTLTAPANFVSSNIGDNSFDLAWSAVAGASSYTVSVGGSTATVSGTTYSASGLVAGTVYACSVVANCSGGGSGASSSISVTTTGVTPLSCSATISSFPYSEGFESGDGWTQSTVDDGDWYGISGATPSVGTGPTSAVEGSNYLFLEASTNGSPGQIGNNATAILESPCFDLSGETIATFSFQNHMYGTSVGSLSLEVTTDDNVWVSIWSESGDQGDQWNAVDVSLDSYIGGTVKLRFVGTTGNGWSSDIAIDDLSLTSSGSSGGGCTTTTVDSNDFEAGWGIWNDGGSDARRNAADAAYSNGTFSIRLRDNSTTSVMTTDNLDLSSFDDLTVSFSYITSSMDNVDEDFWLQLSTDGGSNFTTVEEWNLGDEFSNDVRENDVVSISGPFTATTQLRFRCDASGNSDWVYIDDIVISGCSAATTSDFVTQSDQSFNTVESLEEKSITIYPNPVQNELSINGLAETDLVRLITLSGQVLDQGVSKSTFDMSSRESGIYLIQVLSDEKLHTFKVIKQ